MADKLPQGPTAPARRKNRGIWSDLGASVQRPAEQGPSTSVEPAVHEPEAPSPPAAQVDERPVKKSTKKPTKKSAGGRARGWDRSGQVSVVLGSERHARLKNVWKSNATTYDAIADLIREAIDEKLDQLER